MNLDDLMSQIPIDQVAAQLGVDQAEAEQAVRQAVPALVSGMDANAQDPAGAASLAGALQQHGSDTLLEGGVDLGQVDVADGEKIVHNVFGDNTDAVANQLGGLGGGGAGMFAKLLPMLAPLVMSFLAKSFGGSAGSTTSALGPDNDEGGGIGDVLGGLLGGGEAGGGGLGDLLGGGGGGGGIGDLLGGLLGGGRKE